jgi:hypothetical protein
LPKLSVSGFFGRNLLIFVLFVFGKCQNSRFVLKLEACPDSVLLGDYAESKRRQKRPLARAF